MALSIPILTADLITTFKSPQWATSANLFTNAVDTFIMSGDAKTTVSGTVTPSPPAVPYPSAGQGMGKIITTGKALLLLTCTSAFNLPVWSAIGPILSPAITTLLATSVITTTVTGGLVGVGNGIAAPTGTALLTTQLTKAFVSGTVWEQVANDIAIAINTFITTALVTTADFGAAPFPWVGVGTGSIV